jgi:hypothetical protein
VADRRWGAVDNGATFEALATTIVFFEDPTCGDEKLMRHAHAALE